MFGIMTPLGYSAKITEVRSTPKAFPGAEQAKLLSLSFP